MLGFVAAGIIYERVQMKPFRGRILALASEVRERNRIHKVTYGLVAFGFLVGGMHALYRFSRTEDVTTGFVVIIELAAFAMFTSFAQRALQEEQLWDEIEKGSRERPKK